MQKRQAKTVEFSHLSEDHKAEFLQFLIKNNICFQEGKENCTAKIAIKPNHTLKAPTRPNHLKQPTKRGPAPNENQLIKTSERKSNRSTLIKDSDPLGEISVSNNRSYQMTAPGKQLKTPRKQEMRTSSLSCKENSQTLHKLKKNTPKSVKPAKNAIKQNKKVSDYDYKARSSNKEQKELRNKLQPSKEKQHGTHEKPKKQNSNKPLKKSEVGTDGCNKYASLFDSISKSRPVRWPLATLERTIEEVYDEIFLRNTQCLQTKNIQNAMRTLHLLNFPQLIQGFFSRKYKNSKLASTNLTNLVYSLSYHVSKTTAPCFLKTFEDFLMDSLQYEDALYYLFARNVLKKELRVVQRARELSRFEGTYFADKIKQKDIHRLLKGIIGRDNELLSEYKELVLNRMNGDSIEAYEFLRILLDDFHERRLFNQEQSESEELDDHPLFNWETSYDQRNEELTFGEEHYSHSQTYHRPQFWQCLAYSQVHDSLFELVMDKMGKKAVEFLAILAGDTEKPQQQLERLRQLLIVKAQSLTKAVFQMNKMKWFRELCISEPSEEDMSTVEGVQMRLRRLREAPSGKDIGQFCKSILTVPQLVNELQFSMTASD